MPGDDSLYYPRRPDDAGPAAEQLARGWRQAAERAFSGGFGDPGGYQLTTRLVGGLLEELRAVGAGLEPLLEAWERHAELSGRVVAAQQLPRAQELDLEAVAGAAFAIRYREVVDELLVAERREAIASSTRETWLVLEESGPPAGDPFVPYRRLEVHTGSGRALLVTTRPDDDFAGCVHCVTEGAVDLATGRLLPADEAGSHDVRTAEQREQLVTEMKRQQAPGGRTAAEHD